MVPVNRGAAVLLLMCAALVSHGGEVWTQGVSREAGWYDVNKAFDGVDDGLCWAAAASNMLAWWQDRNAELALASDAPQGSDAIWSTFVQSFGNVEHDKQDYGGFESDGFQWYLEGSIDTTQYHITEYGLTQGGYYKNLLSTVDGIGVHLAIGMFTDAAETTQVLLDALTSGCGVTLGIATSTYAHALTLWGVDCDANGAITKMYLTDSDDERVGQEGLFTVTCEAKNMPVEVWQGHYMDLNVLHIESTETLPSGKKYYGEDVYISDVTWLHATMPRIPEPATATLSLLALAALAAKRRRN